MISISLLFDKYPLLSAYIQINSINPNIIINHVNITTYFIDCLRSYKLSVRYITFLSIYTLDCSTTN